MSAIMKKSLLYLAGIVSIFASCSKELEEDIQDNTQITGRKITIIANVEKPGTKTTVTDAGAYSWQASESIAVIEDGQTTASQFSILDAEAGTFTGPLVADGALKYAVSPAGIVSGIAASGTNYTVTLPASYTGYVSGTSNAVMIAGAPETVEDTYKFTFRQVAALVKFTYENVPVGTTGFKFTTDVNITGSYALDATTGITLSTPATGGKTVTIKLASAVVSTGQSLSFYVPVPVGTIGSFRAVLMCGTNADIEIAGTVKKKTAEVTLAKGDLFVAPTITLSNTMDLLTYDFTGITYGSSATYTDWSNKTGTSGVVYAGQSCTVNGGGYIQLRTKNSSSGIIVTSSSNQARKVCVTWSASTGDGRYITVYGKNTAYSSPTELYDEDNRGAFLGTVKKGTNTTLSIPETDYYAYIGIVASDALYMNEVDITWAEGKDPSNISWSSTTGSATLLTAGNSSTLPSLNNPRSIDAADIEFASSVTSVATVNSSGEVTFVGGGTTKISATYVGDTYRPEKVEYTLTISDERDDAVEPTFNPAAGAVQKNTVVNISSTTAGSTIYYTVNGDTPEVGGATTYSGTAGEASASVTIDAAKTIKAIAVKSTHKTSSVGSAIYSVIGESTPLDDPAGVSIVSMSSTTFIGSWTKDANASDYEWVLTTAKTQGAIVKTGEGANVVAYGSLSDAGISLSGSTYSIKKTGLTIENITEYHFFVKAIGVGGYSDSPNYTDSGKRAVIAFTPNKATTGSNSNSYVDSATSFSVDNVGFSINHWNPNTQQAKCNQSNVANNFTVKNTAEIPGNIKRIEVRDKGTSTAVDGLKLKTGSSAPTGTASTAPTRDGTNGLYYWSVTSAHTYFLINTSNVGGTKYVGEIVIMYVPKDAE